MSKAKKKTFTVGDEVLFLNNPAIVRFVGPTKLSDSKDMVGIELQATTNEGLGKDGSLGGTQYFSCPVGKGKFVNPILLRRPKPGGAGASARGGARATARTARSGGSSSSASRAKAKVAKKAAAAAAAAARSPPPPPTSAAGFAISARVAHRAMRTDGRPPLATIRWLGSLGASAEVVSGFASLPSTALDTYVGIEYDEKIGSCNGSVGGEDKFEGQFDHCVFMHASTAAAELTSVSVAEDRRLTEELRRELRLERRAGRNRRMSYRSGQIGSAGHGVPSSPIADLEDENVSSEEENGDDENPSDDGGGGGADMSSERRHSWRRGQGDAGGEGSGGGGGTTAKIEHVRRLAARTFEAIDKDGNGWLSKEELQETWLEGQQESDLDAEIEQMGGDVRTGRLHKEHFVAHVMNTYESHSSERMRREVTKELQRYLRHALQQQEEMMKKNELENLRVEKAKLTEKLSELSVIVERFKAKGRQAKSQIVRLREQCNRTEERMATAARERDASVAALAALEQSGGGGGGGKGSGERGASSVDQEATVAALKRKIEDLTAENSRLLFELHQEREKYAELQADYTQLEADMQQRLAEAHAAMQAQVAAARGSVDPVRLCQGYQDDLAVVCDDIYVRMSELQGEVDDLQGSLRVICRVRPFIRSATSLDLKAVQGVTTASKANSLKDESARAKIGMLKDIVDIIPDENLVRIRLATRKPTASQLADPAYKRPKGRHEDFVFSHALPYRRSHYTPGGATQEQVYESVKGIALSVLRGYNVVIFAYGGTGSGKTYTMQGPQGEIGDATYIPPIKEQGLYYRIITDLFSYFGKWSNREFVLEIAVADNYLNSVNDLLAPGKPNMAAVLMRGGDPFKHFAQRRISKPSDFVRYLGEAASQRVTGAAINDKSSRSHMAICLTLTTIVSGKAPKTSQLMMVDLAGSESFREVSDRVQGRSDKVERETECLAINKSLNSLQRTMEKIREAQSKAKAGGVAASKMGAVQTASFRGNNLTMLLRNALQPKAGQLAPKILMIACIAAIGRWERTSLNSLAFARDCMKIKLESAVKQEANRQRITDLTGDVEGLKELQTDIKTHLLLNYRRMVSAKQDEWVTTAKDMLTGTSSKLDALLDRYPDVR